MRSLIFTCCLLSMPIGSLLLGLAENAWAGNFFKSFRLSKCHSNTWLLCGVSSQKVLRVHLQRVAEKPKSSIMFCKNTNVWQPWHCTDCAVPISCLVGCENHPRELLCSDIHMCSVLVQRSICLSYHWLNVTISSHQTMKQLFYFFLY